MKKRLFAILLTLSCSRSSSRSRQTQFALIGRIRRRIASAEEESAIIKP